MTNEQEQRGCAAFWGPTKPFFGGDAIQAGCSYYVGTTVFTIARCLLSAFLLGTFVYLIVIGVMDLLFVTNWSYILFAFSYTVLALCSVLVVMRKWNWCDKLAKFVIPAYFVAVTAALFITPIFYLLLGSPPFTFASIVTHGGTFIVHIVDVILGARYRFRIQYTLLTIAYSAAYIAFIWIRFAIYGGQLGFTWQYAFLDPKRSSTPLLVGTYVGLIAWTVGASVLVLLTTRVIPICVRRKPSQENRV